MTPWPSHQQERLCSLSALRQHPTGEKDPHPGTTYSVSTCCRWFHSPPPHPAQTSLLLGSWLNSISMTLSQAATGQAWQCPPAGTRFYNPAAAPNQSSRLLSWAGIISEAWRPQGGNIERVVCQGARPRNPASVHGWWPHGLHPHLHQAHHSAGAPRCSQETLLYPLVAARVSPGRCVTWAASHSATQLNCFCGRTQNHTASLRSRSF